MANFVQITEKRWINLDQVMMVISGDEYVTLCFPVLEKNGCDWESINVYGVCAERVMSRLRAKSEGDES